VVPVAGGAAAVVACGRGGHGADGDGRKCGEDGKAHGKRLSP